MRYPVMLERLPEEEGMPGYYYAHVPSLGLTTHGKGMEGALDAARDLVALWNEDGRQTYLPMHTGDVPTGTFRSILKQAGLTEEGFRDL
jgi:predicted RNase H-like HicB family nuclease